MHLLAALTCRKQQACCLTSHRTETRDMRPNFTITTNIPDPLKSVGPSLHDRLLAEVLGLKSTSFRCMPCGRGRPLIPLLEAHEHKKAVLDTAVAADHCHDGRDLSCSNRYQSLYRGCHLLNKPKIRRHRHTCRRDK